MMFGSLRELSEEELARAIRLDPSQIAGLGPSIDSLIAMLLERKRKILATYETDSVQQTARQNYHALGSNLVAPKELRSRYAEALAQEQLHDLERIWYMADDERGQFARQLVHVASNRCVNAPAWPGQTRFQRRLQAGC